MVQRDRDSRFDMTRYFTGYRLRRGLESLTGISGLGTEVEYNDASGPDNSLLRIGVMYKHTLGGLGRANWFQWRVLPYETDGSGQQLSLIHFMQLSKRFNWVGFIDFHVNRSSPNRWVTESQITCQIHGPIRLALEARYNGFLNANPAADGFGLALGISVGPQ
jgi:hypothetical protein